LPLLILLLSAAAAAWLNYLASPLTMPKRVLLTTEMEVQIGSPSTRGRRPTHDEIKRSMEALIHHQATQVVEAGAALKKLKRGDKTNTDVGKQTSNSDEEKNANNENAKQNALAVDDETTRDKKVKRPQNRTWDSRFEDLLQFKATQGHTNVPKGWEDDPSLYHWTITQRKKYKCLTDGLTNNLSAEQIDRLNEIGEFVFHYVVQ
jgi:hypothetical protein